MFYFHRIADVATHHMRLALGDAAALCGGLRISVVAAAASVAFCVTPASSQTAQVQTIIIIRHGEKPEPHANGQLSPVGLARSLKLPYVLVGTYGRPTAIWVPNPAIQIYDGSEGPFSYVRPLATIEPTAATLLAPVNTQFGYTAIGDLQTALMQDDLHQSTSFVAWEHGQIPNLAVNILTANGGSASQVPASWPECDYDTIYVITISRPQNGGATTSSMAIASEGLGRPANCPQQRPRGNE